MSERQQIIRATTVSNEEELPTPENDNFESLDQGEEYTAEEWPQYGEDDYGEEYPTTTATVRAVTIRKVNVYDSPILAVTYLTFTLLFGHRQRSNQQLYHPGKGQSISSQN